MSNVVQRLTNLRKEYTKKSLNLCYLKKKISQSCDAHGIIVNEELHDDLKAITQIPDCTKLVLDHPEDSFVRIFWQQQLKAMSGKKSANMRWHPLMIRWCLSLRHK